MISRVVTHTDVNGGLALLHIPVQRGGYDRESAERGIISRYPAQGKILTYQATIIMSADADERTPGVV
jgi:hypothetical protein